MATGLFNLKQVNQAISQGAWSGYIAPRWVEYLVVAGGGGGGYTGGGGAGGVLTGIVSVASGASYTVTIGPGGTGSTSGGDNATQGTASVFGSISAAGGGAGILNYNTTLASKNSGGSGGGGGLSSTVNGQGTSGQGNAGGLGSATNGGGGGGAGTVGLAATTYGGNGGAGIASAITGSVVTYGGGGGGGFANSINSNPGAGGVGGGGSATSTGGTSGGGNTGGGGGASVYVNPTYYAGGSGGSGIVVVRYPGNVQFYTGGTVTYSNGYIVHNFTANGTLAPTTPTVVSEYQISRSLRFNPADSAYLNRTPASAGNRRKWTYSAWVKRSATGAQSIFAGGTGTGSTDYLQLYFGPSTDTLRASTYVADLITTTSVYRDYSAWYHIVWNIDTDNATATNRMQLYVNNALVATANVTGDLGVNQTQQHSIGNNTYGTYFGGYMTEINFIDGQALTPTSFGYVNPTTGIWSPAKFVGGYGTNGFYLNFSDNSNTTAATLGADYSGNGNNWTPNNFSVTAGAGNDSLVDSPTSYGTDTGVGGTVRGNYCTLNPVGLGGGTLTNGNLDLSTTVVIPAVGTIAMTTGKWYWEITNNSVSAPRIGVYNIGAANPADLGATANGWCLLNGPSRTYTGGSAVSYGSYSPTTGTVVMVAYDADAGKLWFGQNGTWFASGVPSTGTSPSLSSVTGSAIVPAIANGNSGTDTFSANFGQRPFTYTAPSGYQALCTQNLPTPTIGATTATQAGKYFNPVLYTGTGSSLSVTGVGFQPDWVWIKSRSAATDHGLYDAVRGVQKQLESNNTGAETTETTGITAFGSDGFTTGALAQLNTSSATYVAWNWKANGSGSSNTAGSITSTVSANTTSGFSIVTWTGTGADASIGHGLGVVPSMVIHKFRSAISNWSVYTSTTGAGKRLKLNSSDAVATDGSFPTTPTSTVFYINGGSNDNGVTMVAYCFAPIAGYSAFGSYTGNGSSDGPFVYTGFRPAYLMVKRSDASYDWWIFDDTRSPNNTVTKYLAASLPDAEYTFDIMDFTANGFKIRNGSQGWNGSGGTIIYMAFAEFPFKYSIAR